MSKTRQEIQAEINALMKVEHHVGTNAGTYGATEAVRRVGCADTRFAERNCYETVGGDKRSTGPDVKDAPGRMTKINSQALSADRKRLADLYAMLSSAK